MRLGQAIYTRDDGAVIVYDGEGPDFDLAHIEIDGFSYDRMPLFSLLNRGYWSPTDAMAGFLEELDEPVLKHLAGTEYDHDQQSHAGGGSSSPKVAVIETKDFVDFAVAMTKNQSAKVVTESDNIAGEDSILDDLSNRRAAKSAVMKMVASEMTDVSNEELVFALNLLGIESRALDAIARNTPNPTGVIVFFSNDTTLPYIATYENNLYSDPVREAALDAMKFDLDAGEVFFGELGEPAIARQVNEALKQTVVSELVSAWAQSSNGNKTSRLVQHAAQKELGLDSAVTSDAVRPFDPDYYVESYLKALEKVASAFVRAQYAATQKALSEQFPDQTHFVLHRGGDEPEHYRGKAVNDATLMLRPLASFSTDYTIARVFASRNNLVFSAAVPKERIFSTPLTGNGALHEQEFVVLGGPIAGRVLSPSAADLPLGATEFITVNGQPVPIGKSFAKHLAGTENDHDQQSHAGAGAGNRTELADNEIVKIVSGSTKIAEVYEKIGRALGKKLKTTVGKISDDDKVMYRGFAEPERDIAQLVEGVIPQTPMQTWGQGVYITPERDEAEGYGKVLRIGLSKNARILSGESEWAAAFEVNWPDVGNPTTSLFEFAPGKIPDDATMSDLYNVYWAGKGYDGFTPHGRETVMFNVGVLTIDERDVVSKHLAGTEHDHDQSSHAGGRGKGYTRPDTTNTASRERLFDEVEAMLVRNHGATKALGLRPIDAHYGEGGLYGAVKDRNALDIGDRLVEMGADPDDLLALIMQKEAMIGAASTSNVADSAAILGEQPDPRLSTEERLEVMGRNWQNLAEVVAGPGLPDDVGVVGVQSYDGRWSVRLSRNPEQDVLDGRGDVVLRDRGEWSEDANRVMGYVATDAAQRVWAQSATGKPADAFAAAVMDELGMSVSVSQSPDWSSVTTEPGPYYSPEGRVHAARRAIARAMYENTQEQLKALFPGKDSFVLYRGAAFNDLVNEMDSSRIVGTAVDVTDRMEAATGATSAMAMYQRDHKPLSSWTSKPSTASSFVMDETEFVAAAVVPRERIFSTAFTGLGAFNESEFVVLGGKMPIAVRSSQDDEVLDISQTYLRARLANQSIDADEFITINGQVIPLFKHLAGTEFDHDQQSHAGGGSSTSVPATGGRAEIVKVSDTTYEYEYGDFSFTTDITDPRFLAETGLDRESVLAEFLLDDNANIGIEPIGEFALNTQWNRWESNFVMRHLSAAMMGLDHQYASGGEGFDDDIRQAIIYGERPSDEGAAEYAEGILRDHAATTHAMLQTIANGPYAMEYADSWDGIVRRGMTVTTNEFGEGPLFNIGRGDTLDLALSGFTPDVTLLETFLRGGFQSREYMQPDDDFVFTPNWRSVMFELDTKNSHYIAPADWQYNARDNQVHVSWDDRKADFDAGSLSRTVTAPREVVTAGKFRVSGVRDETRRFTPMFTGGSERISEDMRVITLQQTAVYNPRTNTYDALDGFITLPDGQVVPIEES